MGETGFCKNLRFSAVSCENLRFPAQICDSQVPGFTERAENLRKCAFRVRFLPFAVSLLARPEKRGWRTYGGWREEILPMPEMEASFQHSCKPIPLKLWGWQIHPLNCGGGVSEIPCFTVFSGGAPPKFRGCNATPKF